MTRTIPRLNPLEVHEVDDSGELIIHDAAGRQLMVLNAVGAAVFELIDGEYDVEQIVDVLVSSLAIAREDAHRDVDLFLHDLASRGILHLDGTA